MFLEDPNWLIYGVFAQLYLFVVCVKNQMKLLIIFSASICSMYGKSNEIADHLFFGCNFASKFWSWLNDLLHMHIVLSDIHIVLDICNNNRSSQSHDMVLSAITHTIWVIWYTKNHTRFNNISLLLVGIYTIFMLLFLYLDASTWVNSNSIDEFQFLMYLSVIATFNSEASIIQVTWHICVVG